MKTTKLLIIFLFFSVITQAQYTLTISDVTFENGEIKGYINTTEKDIIIPETLNGQPVTSIGYKAFSYNELTSVTIPNSVITIGYGAFYSNKLTSIIIPKSVTFITGNAFNNNYINNINGESSNGIIYARNNDGSDDLTTITSYGGEADIIDFISNKVTTIGDWAFSYNQLTNITIPNNVTTINNAAFSYNQLTSVTIPNSVTYIGKYAFSYNQLTSVTIPNSVTYIGSKSFNNNSINNINGESSNGIIYARNNDGSDNLTTITSYGGEADIIDFIPITVTTIGEWAFSLNNLTSVTIPNSVTDIGKWSFSYNQLTSIIIPNSVTIIGEEAFSSNKLTSFTLPESQKEGHSLLNWTDGTSTYNEGTTINNLKLAYTANFSYILTINDVVFENGEIKNYTNTVEKNIKIPENLDGQAVFSIGSFAFANKQLASVIIPNTIISINGIGAFQENKLTSITIPNSITSIEFQTFSYNQLTSVTIPNSVTKIGRSAFRSNNLENINLPSSITIINDAAFSENELISITIPSNVTHIGSHAFSQNQLTSVVIPNSVTYIGNLAFNSNKISKVNNEISNGVFYSRNSDGKEDFSKIISYGGIKTVIDFIPSSVTSIGDFVFNNGQLTNVSIPNSVVNIGKGAFRRNNLTNITIPNSVTYIGKDAFLENQIASIVLPETQSQNRTFLNWSDGTNIYKAGVSINNFSVAYSAKFDGPYTLTTDDVIFENNEIKEFLNNAEKDIIIPEILNEQAVLIIGYGAFQEKELEKVNIAISIDSIGEMSFWDNRLINIIIPNGVVSIGPWAFESNGSISITIPNSVTNIGKAAFNKNSINSINGLASDGIIYARNNAGNDDKTTIVSYGGVAAIIDFIPNSVIKIGDYAFSYNKEISDVIIPEGVTSIGENAFWDNKIYNITLSLSLDSIGKGAFRNNQLTNVTIPNSVIYIGESTFVNNQLTGFNLPYAEKEDHTFVNWTDGTNFYNGNEEVSNLDLEYTAVFTENQLGIVNDLDMNIKVYPNPSKGNILIESSIIKHIKVYTTKGLLIKEYIIRNGILKMNLEEQSRGTYFLKMYTNESVMVKKIILE